MCQLPAIIRKLEASTNFSELFCTCLARHVNIPLHVGIYWRLIFAFSYAEYFFWPWEQEELRLTISAPRWGGAQLLAHQIVHSYPAPYLFIFFPWACFILGGNSQGICVMCKLSCFCYRDSMPVLCMFDSGICSFNIKLVLWRSESVYALLAIWIIYKLFGDPCNETFLSWFYIVQLVCFLI